MDLGVNIRYGDISSYFNKPMGIENKWGRAAVQAARVCAVLCGGVGLLVEGGCLLALYKNRIRQVKFKPLTGQSSPKDFGVSASQLKSLKNGSIIHFGNEVYVLSDRAECNFIRDGSMRVSFNINRKELIFGEGINCIKFKMKQMHSVHNGNYPVIYKDL
jgi:hypothetical protein